MFSTVALILALATEVPCATLLAPEFGHYTYHEAPRASLVPVGNGELMQRDAARAFLQMQSEARTQGVTLTAISGFRSEETQRAVFYGIARQRGQTPAQRAKVSAPPGHSQHETGYAVDINSLSESFETTKAFAWLHAHAASYGFHLSFPRHNRQGVSYEPWHYAWHGSAAARLALHDACAPPV